MNSSFLIGTILSGIVLLSGCTPTQTPQTTMNPPAGQDRFDELHDHDMAEKEQQEADAGTVPSTIDVLMPEGGQNIVTETVEYTPGVNGFLAYPEDNPNAPGIVVIHERRGLNEHIEDMARIFAMNGYKALAVDLYEGQVAESSDMARELSSGLDQDNATRHLLDAEAYLRQTSEKVASLGRCMGGKQSLELSLASDSLDATVIYYGRLYDDPEVLVSVNQPLLGIFAELDNGIPPSAVAAFQAGLDTAGISEYDITIYPGVGHAFANPTGSAFAEEATRDARQKTLSFLATHLE